MGSVHTIVPAARLRPYLVGCRSARNAPHARRGRRAAWRARIGTAADRGTSLPGVPSQRPAVRGRPLRRSIDGNQRHGGAAGHAAGLGSRPQDLAPGLPTGVQPFAEGRCAGQIDGNSAPWWRGWSCGRAVEVVALVEVVDEPGLGRLPAQQLAGQRARGRAVEPRGSRPARRSARLRPRERWRPPGGRGGGRSPRRCRGSARPRRRPRAAPIRPGPSPAPGGTGARRRAGARRASGWTRRRCSRRRPCRGRCRPGSP